MIESVYICSAARSGSTILDLMLGTHPAVLPVGELNQLPKNIALRSTCSCGRAIHDCAFWVPIVDELGRRLGTDLWREPYALDLGMIQAGVEIDRRRQTRSYLARRALQRAWVEVCHRAGLDLARSAMVARFRAPVQNLVALHALLRERSGARVVVDSNKDFRQSVLHYQLEPERTRLILLVRDGRGVMASYMRSGRGREQAIKHWMRYYERVLPWLQRHVAPEHLIRVRYEALVADPDAEIGRILACIGLEPVQGVAASVEHPRHIVNGNRMFLQRIAGIRADERWRAELGPADLECFESRTSVLRRRLDAVLGGGPA